MCRSLGCEIDSGCERAQGRSTRRNGRARGRESSAVCHANSKLGSGREMVRSEISNGTHSPSFGTCEMASSCRPSGATEEVRLVAEVFAEKGAEAVKTSVTFSAGKV